MENLQAVVIGAGMGGLTASIALRQAGFRVRVFDRVRELSPAGAGVSLWSNGVKVLNRLGLGAELRAIGGQMSEMGYRSKGGAPLCQFSLEPLVRAVGERPYPVTRTELQRMLLGALAPESVQLDSRCVGVEPEDAAVTALFADGRRATADLVVAADGTHSILREHVLGQPTERRPSGYVNFNGLVAASPRLTPRAAWITFVGDHKRAALMPVAGERFYFFFDVPMLAGAPPWPGGIRVELAHHFSGWAEPVQALIAELDPARTQRIEIHDHAPLPRLVRGRVALLGDAGHSTAPDLGQGGCQAMEDAWVLANVLTTNNLGVEDALLRYEAARRARTTEIIERARKRSDVTHGADPAATLAWYEELAAEDGSRIIRALTQTIQGGPLG